MYVKRFLMPHKNPFGSTASQRVRVGISRCLLGEPVRYDGGHRYNGYINKILGKCFEFVAVCPEVAIGLGTPRLPLRLVGDAHAPRAVGVNDPGFDVTERLDEYARSMVEPCRYLSGYLFKRNSPSCGMERVKVFNAGGAPSSAGAGIYAKRLMTSLPHMPVEDEGRLADPVLRENFVTRVFVYRRWQELEAMGVTLAGLVRFHIRHRMLIRAHGETGYHGLGRLVASAGTGDINAAARAYVDLLMKTLMRPATRKQHGNVLAHLAGHLKRDIDAGAGADLVRLIAEYRLGRVPLAVPITVLKDHFRRYPDPSLGHRLYLDPYPEALELRHLI